MHFGMGRRIFHMEGEYMYLMFNADNEAKLYILIMIQLGEKIFI